MRLIPSMDLLEGRVVRLLKGERASASSYPVTPEAWVARLVAAGARRIHLVDLGAAFGDPDQGASFSYYAAVLLPEPSAVALDPEIQPLELPAGLYARYCLQGPYSRIDSALMAIFSRWLPASGYEPDDRPTLEHYLNSPRTAKPAALRTDLLIPIRATTTP